MGLFSKLSFKTRRRQLKIECDRTGVESDEGSASVIPSSSLSSSSPINSSPRASLHKVKLLRSRDVTVQHLPALITDLEYCLDSKRTKTPKSLKLLFTLSERVESNNRVMMVQGAQERLIPVLLRFLNFCPSKSSEQYLALLILNNISIPAENKRTIALDSCALQVLSRLLCEDPSCHLIAIILVNLTFTDSIVRNELIAEESVSGLIESLCYALRVASLTPEEYDLLLPFLNTGFQRKLTSKSRLEILMEEDKRLRDESSYKQGRNRAGEQMIDVENQKFPETSRWCLAALKNLSRPCNNSTVGEILIHSKMMNVILQYITVSIDLPSEATEPETSTDGRDSSREIQNAPHTWDFNSIQDTALHIVLNLCACDCSRDFVREAEAISMLSSITEFNKIENLRLAPDQEKQQEFQCLKARMALAYLVGSYGNFGQEKMSSTTSTVYANPKDSVLVMSETEAEGLVELLANSLHQRGKDGAGGYSVSTFDTKAVLFALRCLLVHTLNQSCMLKVAGRLLNSLLLKALALHSTRVNSHLDAVAAEYACFSLYLLSNYGFKDPFLPSWSNDEKEKDILPAKVLSSYLHMTDSITPIGRHAAEQLLLRLKYMTFEGQVEEVVSEGGLIKLSDVMLEEDILSKIIPIYLGIRVHGAKPRDDIFDRPILRRRKPKDGNEIGPWDNLASVTVFSSALQAVQQLSFGSRRVRHVGLIDDVLIANNIAKSANGERTESYNFMWSWKDKAGLIQSNMKRQRSLENRIGTIPSSLTASSSNMENMYKNPILSRLACGLACGNDTTTD